MCFRPPTTYSTRKCPQCAADCGQFDAVCDKCGAALPEESGDLAAPGIPAAPGAPGAPAAPGLPKPPGAPSL